MHMDLQIWKCRRDAMRHLNIAFAWSELAKRTGSAKYAELSASALKDYSNIWAWLVTVGQNPAKPYVGYDAHLINTF